MGKVTWDWRWHNEKLHDMSSLNITRMIKSRKYEMRGARSTYWERRGTCKVLVGKPQGKKPLARTRHRWIDNITMNIQRIG
jgi:hypothetical protein